MRARCSPRWTAWLHRMMPREAFAPNFHFAARGRRTPIDLLIERFLRRATRGNMVEGKGSSPVRGGIIDVYPADAERGAHRRFFDDELDSIRAVDV